MLSKNNKVSNKSTHEIKIDPTANKKRFLFLPARSHDFESRADIARPLSISRTQEAMREARVTSPRHSIREKRSADLEFAQLSEERERERVLNTHIYTQKWESERR